MYIRNPSILRWYARMGLTLLVLACAGKIVWAQPGGGGGQPALPAFDEPKFRDRVWESGGPRIKPSDGGKIILGVEIRGNRTVSEHRILSHMQTRVDRAFDSKQLEADIRELWRTELFESIKPSTNELDGGVVVVLEVRERPIATDVIFKGNRGISNGMLEKHCGIKKGDPINPASLDLARRRLIELYLENGFNQIDIQIRSGKNPSERLVLFEINEGPLERIDEIHFEGNSFASEELLKVRIQCRDSRWGLTQYMANKAVISTIEADKETLAGYYRSLGFFQARVGYRIEYDTTGKWMKLTFVIYEGMRFKIRNVAVMGNKYHEESELGQLLKMQGGEYFNEDKMMRDVRSIKDLYGAQGFVFVDVQPEPRYLEEPGMIDIVYRVEEGDRYRAGDIRVHIEGDSSHTKHTVALNYLGRVRPGAIIDMRELQRAERRLIASGIFSTQQTGGAPPSIEVKPPDQEETKMR
jgi:outer membrane protein insertion porin family